MGKITLYNRPDKKKLVADLRSEFRHLEGEWEIDLNEKDNIEIRTSILRVIVKFYETDSNTKVGFGFRWTLYGFFLCLLSLSCFAIPCILWSLFSVQPKINKAKRHATRVLKEKYIEATSGS